MKIVSLFFLIPSLTLAQNSDTKPKCDPTVTTVSGTYAPTNKICSGNLIFEESFDSFDVRKWQHENTLSGGGNWEFQWYNNNRTNSYVQSGHLVIKPSLLADQFGEEFLSSGTLNIEGGAPADRCTNPSYYGCERVGTPNNILNPIKSARLRTIDSFRFKYGKVEFSAKMPAGDWLWPASGEIDIAESRGNKKLTLDGVNIGTEQMSSTLHFGPYANLDGWEKSHFKQHFPGGYDTAFKKYQLDWTPDYLKFSIDGEEIGKVTPPKSGGFWKLGNFETIAPNVENPWRFGTKMAPFDEEFYLIINLAIGGINFFPDDATNPHPKPWSNKSPTAMRDFYAERDKWLDTWNLEQKSSPASLRVNYVKVWAL
ncbi:beta-1,3-glucan-binding protein-like isoform X2 [Arctopsyche grandis]|uniref:beta-1,3-glucan-binding protein-like isoform X2 n=1 Tax=Arctopsyche grandis TaxID=121162 RepID=UPI00406D91E7